MIFGEGDCERFNLGLCMCLMLNTAFIHPCIFLNVRPNAHFLHHIILMSLSAHSVSDLEKLFDMPEYPKPVMTNELM